MTGREQALLASTKTLEGMPYENARDRLADRFAGATAATNVWEPLLRDLLDAVRGVKVYEDGVHYPPGYEEACRRAREALDG